LNHLVDLRAKTHKITLPDSLVDGQKFPLAVDGKAWTAVWLRREAQLILIDEHGLEKNYRLRDVQTVRDEGEAETRLPDFPASVRPDVPGQTQRAKAQGDGTAIIKSPITGKVLKVLVKVGDLVDASTPLAIVEAMKMENRLFAPGPGKVQLVLVKEGDAVQTGKELFRIAPPSKANA
jgi:biotin carboxyl carrier protein